MNNPLPPEALAALAQLAPKTPRDFLPKSPAAQQRAATVDEAMQLVRNIFRAINRTERLPITAAVTEADGQLTVTIAPNS